MVTPEVIRLDLAKLDALMEAFEAKYLHFLDLGEDEMEERNKGSLAFYTMRDLIKKMTDDAGELCGHMEVCDAIFAVNAVKEGGRKDG